MNHAVVTFKMLAWKSWHYGKSAMHPTLSNLEPLHVVFELPRFKNMVSTTVATIFAGHTLSLRMSH